MTKRQTALLERLEAWFDTHPHATALDAARDMRMPPEAAKAVIGLGVSAGRLIGIGGEVYSRRGFLALVTDLRGKLGGDPFAPRQLREAVSAGRAWADQLAEVLERKGLLDRAPGGWRLKQPEEGGFDSGLTE